MTTNAVQQPPVSSIVLKRWEGMGQKLTALAQEIPDHQFDYRPVDGVRTIADVLRHVAFWNQYVADTVRGRTADDATNELPGDRYSTKKQIVDALVTSSADVAQALKEGSSGLSPEMIETIVSFIEHSSEHYGQLVVYARMNGITPPASRG